MSHQAGVHEKQAEDNVQPSNNVIKTYSDNLLSSLQRMKCLILKARWATISNTIKKIIKTWKRLYFIFAHNSVCLHNNKLFYLTLHGMQIMKNKTFFS